MTLASYVVYGVIKSTPMYHIYRKNTKTVEDCEQIATKKKIKTPSGSIVDIEHNKLNNIQEMTGGVMHPSGDTIVCEGSKEIIGEEVVDQILHIIQVELSVRVEKYT